MLPGRFDRLALVVNAFAIVIPLLFTILTSVAFYDHLKNLAGSEALWSYLLNNAFAMISGPGGVFTAFLITTIGATISFLRNFRGNLREMELRRAFAVGLWHGYERNFLGRVVSSFTDKGSPPPIIIVASPSLDMVSASFDVRRFLSKQVPAAIERYGYSLTSIYGEGDAPWFRQAFQATRGVTSEVQVFFDLPTTFVAFEGAIEDILARRRKFLSQKEKEEYFNEMKEEFFKASEKWSKRAGAPVHKIALNNQDPDLFAQQLANLLTSLSVTGETTPDSRYQTISGSS